MLGGRAAYYDPKDGDGNWFGGAQARLYLGRYCAVKGPLSTGKPILATRGCGRIPSRFRRWCIRSGYAGSHRFSSVVVLQQRQGAGRFR
ncbi:hypothetical protein YTPLAS18_15480 [Nitrospira sp.]|nr:hypothetical protein YTPLAS18_15480 [Nitrospira sp.]